MKVILTHEVTGLGSSRDVVGVKDGYARNFLLRRGLATGWTKGVEKQVAAIQKGREVREVKSLDEAKGLKGQLEAKPVKVAAKAGKSGRLFGAVTQGDVADAVKASGVAPSSTVARSSSPARSSRPARSRRSCVCTPRCRPRSSWTSSPSDAAHRMTPKGADPHRIRALCPAPASRPIRTPHDPNPDDPDTADGPNRTLRVPHTGFPRCSVDGRGMTEGAGQRYLGGPTLTGPRRLTMFDTIRDGPPERNVGRSAKLVLTAAAVFTLLAGGTALATTSTASGNDTHPGRRSPVVAACRRLRYHRGRDRDAR